MALQALGFDGYIRLLLACYLSILPILPLMDVSIYALFLERFYMPASAGVLGLRGP